MKTFRVVIQPFDDQDQIYTIKAKNENSADEKARHQYAQQHKGSFIKRVLLREIIKDDNGVSSPHLPRNEEKNYNAHIHLQMHLR